MDVMPVMIVLLPVFTALAVGLLGTTRRIGFWGALIGSLLLTPLGGFIVTLISGPKRRGGGHAKRKVVRAR